MSDANSRVVLRCDEKSPRFQQAVRLLHNRLPGCGYRLSSGGDGLQLKLEHAETGMPREAFTIASAEGSVTIHAGDDAGVIYGAHRLVELLSRGDAVADVPPAAERPRLQFRAIKYDLPWDSYRHSTALSQHTETCKDISYWEAFLDMMSEHRLNVLTLWNLHPYPFMIRPRNYPEACPFDDEEMVEWKRLYGGIFAMATDRGIDTYIMPFNIFVSPEFARAHNVTMNNLEHHFHLDGDQSEIIKVYTRECVTQVLDEYPLLSGIGLTLGEGMGGMTPQEREDWIHDTIIEGMRMAGRKSKLIHRIPFSGDTRTSGETTVEMEVITRAGIEREAAMDFVEGPVWAGLKFNWSHPLSTTELIKVHGGKLYGKYFDPVPRDYRVFWTARNEDSFCLRWGVPGFIREHIARNAHEYVGGYMIGSETYIPARDYFTRPEHRVPWRYAFERQWLYYKLWGRLLYDWGTPDEVFASEFTRRYGASGPRLAEAHALAGQTLLRLGFSFDIAWDFTLYAEGFMARNPDTGNVQFISVDWLIDQPPLDPRYVQIPEYVAARTAGVGFADERVTPVGTAEALEADCSRALELVGDIEVSRDIALMFEVADVTVWSYLGLYFASKLRGAVALQTYRVTGAPSRKSEAIDHLTEALGHWDSVVSITRPLYRDMPLVHLSEQDGKPWRENDHLRFHWEHLRVDVAADLEIARNAVPLP